MSITIPLLENNSNELINLILFKQENNINKENLFELFSTSSKAMNLASYDADFGFDEDEEWDDEADDDIFGDEGDEEWEEFDENWEDEFNLDEDEEWDDDDDDLFGDDDDE